MEAASRVSGFRELVVLRELVMLSLWPSIVGRGLQESEGDDLLKVSFGANLIHQTDAS